MSGFRDERISKEVMEQYEVIRRSGVTNMFDIFAVKIVAKRVGLDELAKLSRADYIYLLQNFGTLMSGYGVQQENSKERREKTMEDSKMTNAEAEGIETAKPQSDVKPVKENRSDAMRRAWIRRRELYGEKGLKPATA
jgi:hypothetical protein